MYIPVGWPQRLRLPRFTRPEGRGVDPTPGAVPNGDGAATTVNDAAHVAPVNADENDDAPAFRLVVANSPKTLFLCVSPREIAIWKFRPQVDTHINGVRKKSVIVTSPISSFFLLTT